MNHIAIDGPAGAGKSSVAKEIARRLGITYLDTGAMYRAIGLKALNNGIDPLDAPSVIELLKDTMVDVVYIDGLQHVMLDGMDVTFEIRRNEMSKAASDVSAIPEVRKLLVKMQQDIAQGKDVIMDGRDIGTDVLPHAKNKFFITASTRERAKRRYNQLKRKGTLDKTLDELEQEIITRDHNDSSRACSPLRMAQDAVLIDTTTMEFESVVRAVLQKINESKA